MASLLDTLFGSSSSRADKINKATSDAEAGVKVTNPTLGNPGGDEAKVSVGARATPIKESSALMELRKKRKKRAALASRSSLSSAVRSVN